MANYIYIGWIQIDIEWRKIDICRDRIELDRYKDRMEIDRYKDRIKIFIEIEQRQIQR